MSPEEYQIWTLFNSFRIGSGLAFVGTAIFIWLGFRIAVGTRVPASGEEPQMIGKILSSIFCLLICLGTWVQWTEYAANYIGAAYGINQLKESGTEVTEIAEGFLSYVGTTEATLMPTPLGIASIVVIGIMYAAIIWTPKQN